MKLLKNLLVAIAATGMMGSVQAQTPPVNYLGTLDPTVQTRSHLLGAGSLSFVDVFNFTIGAINRNYSGSTVALGPNGTPSATTVAGLTYALFSGFNAPGTPLSSPILIDSSGRLDLSALLTPGDFSVRISGTAGPVGGGFSFSTAANPEPAEWMMLLAGLVVVGFIARRKTRLMAG
jgi:hypothetical protein